MVSSRFYEKNIKILEELHAELEEWARERDVSFNPSKYEVLHFWRKCLEVPKPTCIPDIGGLASREDLPKDMLKVLGVIVDQGLTFDAHIDDVGSISICLSAFLSAFTNQVSSFCASILFLSNSFRFTHVLMDSFERPDPKFASLLSHS
jgi:hypothetical protein